MSNKNNGIDWLIKNASSAMPSDLKSANRWQVLQAFRDGLDHTVTEIAGKTGISRLTTMKAIRFFCDKGLLFSVGKGDSLGVGGKKPEFFSFRCDKYLLCISIGSHLVYLTLYNMAHCRIGSVRLEIRPEMSLEDILHSIRIQAGWLMTQNMLSVEQLFGVGVSTAAIVDYRTGTLRYNRFAPHWPHGFPMAARIREIFGTDIIVYIESTSKAIGRSALIDAAFCQDKRIMTLYLDEGLSACMIEYGHVLNGSQSLIGEVGRMVMTDGGEACRTVDSLTDNTWLRNMIHAEADANNSPVIELGDRATIGDLFTYSGQGDPWAVSKSEKLAQNIAVLLYNASFFFNPQIVIFYGVYAQADVHFRQELCRSLRRLKYFFDEDILQIEYDQRLTQELETLGLYTALSNSYFRLNTLYEDEAPECTPM